ncbi:hypothetical protein, partial [uncultured Maritalea sp.]|uniref:hypothetical protein n=1 Tax=uncultured Maritalea sp. TaxID=757249 RepID=UPI0026137999
HSHRCLSAIMKRFGFVFGGVILLCLGIWLGMHIERWLIVDSCLDGGGAINIERGFYDCEFE